MTVVRLYKDSPLVLGWLVVSDCCETETDQRQPSCAGQAAARLWKLTEVLAWSVTVLRVNNNSLVVLGRLQQGSRNSLKFWHG